jgi:secondary thiamine-phosphate synthase enzyme
MIYQREIRAAAAGHGDVKDITGEVVRLVAASGIQTGIAQVFVTGSTAAIVTIECEPGLARDLPEMLDRLVPPSRSYGHEQAWHDGNGHSHLQATTLGPSLSLPISRGEPALGTWQQIVLVECDIRARERTVVVTVMGE